LTPLGRDVAKKIRLLGAGLWRAEDLQHAILTWLNHLDIPAVHEFVDAP
jgi:hypothetical protein